MARAIGEHGRASTVGVRHFRVAYRRGFEALRGVTSSGDFMRGSNCDSGGGCGTVFAITTTGKENVLYSFKGGSKDGENPQAGLINVDGTLYGTTIYGGAHQHGTVFAITKAGTETLLHSFGAWGDGQFPYAGLVNVKGTLYGTTQNGGAKDAGTVFSITTSGKEIVLHSSSGCPEGAVLNLKGTLYGTTSEGGANGEGTVFSLRL